MYFFSTVEAIVSTYYMNSYLHLSYFCLSFVKSWHLMRSSHLRELSVLVISSFTWQQKLPSTYYMPSSTVLGAGKRVVNSVSSRSSHPRTDNKKVNNHDYCQCLHRSGEKQPNMFITIVV